MLGYWLKGSNDIHIYFEPEEITNLPDKKILGTFFNYASLKNTGTLTALLLDNNNEAKTDVEKTDSDIVERMDLTFGQRFYNKLKTKGSVEEHQGFRHVFLYDTSKFEFGADFQYNSLKKLLDLTTQEN